MSRPKSSDRQTRCTVDRDLVKEGGGRVWRKQTRSIMDERERREDIKKSLGVVRIFKKEFLIEDGDYWSRGGSKSSF